jgi:hypothetical protein
MIVSSSQLQFTYFHFPKNSVSIQEVFDTSDSPLDVTQATMGEGFLFLCFHALTVSLAISSLRTGDFQKLMNIAPLLMKSVFPFLLETQYVCFTKLPKSDRQWRSECRTSD